MFLQKIFALFFFICIGVHVYGLLIPFSSETILSHLVHILSYGLCLWAVVGGQLTLSHPNAKVFIYGLGSIYPLFIHVPCTFSAFANGGVNWVCLLVIIFIPAGFLAVRRL